MWGLSIWHWLIVAGVVMLLFGRNLFSRTMGDIAGGIRELRKGAHELVDGSDDPKPRA